MNYILHTPPPHVRLASQCQLEIFKALNTKTKPNDFPLQGGNKSDEASVWQVKSPQQQSS